MTCSRMNCTIYFYSYYKVSAAPVGFRRVAGIYFFIHIPKAFSNFFASVFSAGRQVVSTMDSMVSICQHAVPGGGSAFEHYFQTSTVITSDSRTLTSVLRDELRLTGRLNTSYALGIGRGSLRAAYSRFAGNGNFSIYIRTYNTPRAFLGYVGRTTNNTGVVLVNGNGHRAAFLRSVVLGGG